MTKTSRIVGTGSALALTLMCLAAVEAEGQGRGNRGRGGGGEAPSAGLTLSIDVKSQILEFYASGPASGAEALPPGIRRNLERGKALPPGIAKKSPPPALQSALDLPEGYEIVEVGLDVFLVEVATSIIHDVLLDVIR